jgi:hypothetical protein
MRQAEGCLFWLFFKRALRRSVSLLALALTRRLAGRASASATRRTPDAAATGPMPAIAWPVSVAPASDAFATPSTVAATFSLTIRFASGDAAPPAKSGSRIATVVPAAAAACIVSSQNRSARVLKTVQSFTGVILLGVPSDDLGGACARELNSSIKFFFDHADKILGHLFDDAQSGSPFKSVEAGLVRNNIQFELMEV